MSQLQLGLIVAGVVLVVGVLIYNWLQERRVRKRIREAFRDPGAAAPGAAPRVATGRGAERVEPTLARAGASTVVPANPAAAEPVGEDEADYEPPLDVQASIATDLAEQERGVAPAPAPVGPATADRALLPDPDIECVVSLQPVRPVSAGAVAAGLHARIGKPLRWFGRRGADAPWQPLKSDTAGQFSEIAACLLLADRAGAASKELIDAFARLAGSVASSLPAAFVPPDSAHEAARAEALDRLCADLDVQIGLTVLKTGGATIAGTRLRGVAEAAGFRLGHDGRFDWVQEETGAVLYSLANFRPEAFTIEALRSASTPGAVFLLDVPRVADPARVFDQMKLAAKRMAHTLDAVLVDDNRRPLDDAALASIREQVHATAMALTEVNIAPGSPRAMALFGS
jgi:FtsZ-interacting cell division protein ZipA